MDPYVPADNLALAQNIVITADDDCGHITYVSPYAHYQWEGELYGQETIRSRTGEKLLVSTPRHTKHRQEKGCSTAISGIRWQQITGTRQ